MQIGDIFEDSYPVEAADWCMENNAKISEIEPINGVRRFQIVADIISVDELKSQKRNQRDFYMTGIQWRVERYDSQSKLGIETNDSEETYMSILRYMQYLRDIPQEPAFPNIDIKTFEEWAQ